MSTASTTDSHATRLAHMECIFNRIMISALLRCRGLIRLIMRVDTRPIFDGQACDGQKLPSPLPSFDSANSKKDPFIDTKMHSSSGTVPYFPFRTRLFRRPPWPQARFSSNISTSSGSTCCICKSTSLAMQTRFRSSEPLA